MKKIKITLALLITVLILSGCSVTAINDALKNTAKENKDSVSQPTVGTYIESESEDAENSSSKTESKSDNEKGTGESFDAAIDYETEDGEKVTVGKKGLSYTFNSYEIYDNFFESGLDFRASMLEYDFETEKYYLTESKESVYKNNMFILVDMTATYNAPEGGAERIEIHITNDIIARNYSGTIPEELMEEFISLRDNNIIVVYPNVNYLSTVPLPENGLFPDHDVLMANFLNDGEELNFQIGIICWEKFVEDKDLYLSINGFNPGAIEGYDGRYFAIFPEE